MPSPTLQRPLPPVLPAGSATALWLHGHTGGARRVEVSAGGRRAVAVGPPGAWWWATLDAVMGDGPLLVEAATPQGSTPLATIAAGPAAFDGAAGGPTIAVCLATHEPDPGLLRVQLESLKAQTDEDWVCVIADDASSAAGRAAIEAAVGGDPRFEVRAFDERVGFHRNFERALALAPAGAGLIALCDHDDRWDRDKLATLRAAMAGGATLAFSDQRLTTPAGEILQPSLWRDRANNTGDLAALLVANTVTGAAAMLRRDVVARALPFPDPPGIAFHDHWLALVALAAGELAYVDRPLYDYVQHPRAVFGDVATGASAPPRPGLRDRLAGGCLWGYEARAVYARTLLLRCDDVLTAPKRAALQRFLAAPDRLGALGRLAAPALRRRSSTLGAEAGLAGGVLWRRWVAASRRLPAPLRPDLEPPGLLAFDQPGLRRWRASLGAR